MVLGISLESDYKGLKKYFITLAQFSYFSRINSKTRNAKN